MEISLKFLSHLSEILASDLNTYYNCKDKFHEICNNLISYYQKNANKIFSQEEIKMIFTFYRLLLLIKGINLDSFKFGNVLESSHLGINLITEEYLIQKKVKITLEETDETFLEMKNIFKKNFFEKTEIDNNGIKANDKNSQNDFFLDSKLLLVYELVGAIDHLYLAYLCNLINSTKTENEEKCYPYFLKHSSITLINLAKPFFDDRLEYFERNQDYDFNKNFLNYVNYKENNFLEHLTNHFYLFLLKKNKKQRKKILKLLFLGLNCVQDKRLKEVVDILNKYFAKNFYFISNQKEETFSYIIMSHFTKKKLVANSENHFMMLLYRKKISEDKFSFYTENYPVNSENLNLVEKINSPSIHIYIFNKECNLVHHHKLLKPVKLDRSFFHFREQDFYSEDFENFSLFRGKSSVILNLLSNNHIEMSQLKKKTQILKEKNLNLFTILDFKKLKSCKDNFQINKYIQKAHNPLENLKLLRIVAKNLVRFAKKYNLSGFFIEKFTQSFEFTILPKKQYYSLEYLQREIFDYHLYARAPFYTLNENLKNYQNPLLVYLTQKFFTSFQSFQIVTPKRLVLLSLGNIFYIKDFSNNKLETCDNYFNFLNTQFYRRILYYPINLNLLLEVKIHDNVIKNSLLKFFFKFLKKLFNVTFLFTGEIIGKGSFLYSNALVESTTLMPYNFTCYYFPLIFEGSENNILGCFTYSESSINIYIQRIDSNDESGDIKICLKNLYDFFHRKNVEVGKVVNFHSNGKIEKFYLFEILNNNLFVNVENFYTGEIVFLEDQNDEDIEFKGLQKNYKYNIINEFLKKLNYHKEFNLHMDIDYDFFIEEFKKIITNLKINDINDLNQLFNLDQVNQEKENYQFFLILVEKMIKNNIKFENTEIKKKELLTLLNSKKMGKIAVLTPEYGKFVKVGGLAVMIEDLVEELKHLGEELIVLIPFYNKDSNDNTEYLNDKGLIHIYNLTINLHEVDYSIGVSFLKEKNITFYFLHNYYLFPKIYTYYDKDHQLKQISLYNLAAMKVLERENEQPSIVVTNDWFAGLAACYAKSHFFNGYFKKTHFFHIVHNMGDDYQGRIHLNSNERGKMKYISGLDEDFFVDPFWTSVIVNPLRCALMFSDQWGTVSKSYKKEILEHSSLKYLLSKFENPFAFPNGVRSSVINERFKKIHSHELEKIFLMKKFFGYDFDDNSKYDEFILFGFVGRITEQKGVLLILDVFESLLTKYDNKILFIVGGMKDNSDYSITCAEKMNYLRNAYPKNFWGDPEVFFTIGTSLNKGADFFLMPSKFEPGGIVQHESLIAGTPVIAFKTGGLQDTIFEYLPFSDDGNGFNFLTYNNEDFMYAIERAINCYQDKQSYSKLRLNCLTSFIEVSTVAKAWRGEFYRLKNIVSLKDPNRVQR